MVTRLRTWLLNETYFLSNGHYGKGGANYNEELDGKRVTMRPTTTSAWLAWLSAAAAPNRFNPDN